MKAMPTLFLTEEEAKLLHDAEKLLLRINIELLTKCDLTLNNYDDIYDLLHDPEKYDMVVEGF